ncbi:MAG: glycoside hydrolase family 92 protein [Planctomycetota bacterium]|nr:glycoside hydrolase family 92 protein [Planctomycetota bacterium]
MHGHIRFDPGSQFAIKTYGNSAKNCYIQKAKLNGKPLDKCWFHHSDYVQGGLLELWLGPAPNRNWGVADLPVTASRIPIRSIRPPHDHRRQ